MIGPAASPAGAPYMPPPAARARGAARTALLVGFGLTAALLITLLLVVTGLEVGPMALVLGILLAVVPAPIYVALGLVIDRYEPEPVWMIATTFLWGASVAVFFAFIVNTAGAILVGVTLGGGAAEIYAGSISAPVVEELAKAAVLFIIFFRKRAEFDGVLDGIVYATMVGLGFAVTENILYYGQGALEFGLPGALGTFVLRGILSPFAHPLFTSMTGLGLGLALQSRNRGVQVFAPLAGLAAAMFLHSLWNTSAAFGAALVGVYLLIFVPLFIAVIVIAVLSLQREGRIVRHHLQPDVQSGLLAAEDVARLSNLGSRRRALRAAKKREGRDGKRTLRTFILEATELAFHRHRTALGRAGKDGTPAEQEAGLVAAVRDLKSRLGPSWGEQPAPAIAAAQASVAPAHWYPDPHGQARLRYWDGRTWTGYVAS